MSRHHHLHGAPHIMTGGPEARAGSGANAGIRRLNRLPLLAAIVVVLIVIATTIFGLSSRGFWRGGQHGERSDDGGSATSFAENLKRGISDGIIGENPPAPVSSPASLPVPEVISAPRLDRQPAAPAAEPSAPVGEPANGKADDDWRTRLQREHEEQILSERHRQDMARLQRAEGARGAPLRIDARHAGGTDASVSGDHRVSQDDRDPLARRLSAAALALQDLPAGMGGQDPQDEKRAFLEAGRGPLSGIASPDPETLKLMLKRGSVIPAMLMTGINADLPGHILAQVSQNVYDSATGTQLLVPQGSRLVGRYDSKVSYGQSRVLVVWTDIVLPDGRSLDIGAMAGIDQQGQAGFKDKIDRHLFQTFGSAALVAMIGTGMDLALPGGGSPYRTDASDAARRSFSETFGRLAERTISKNLDVQPTLTIRPGYRFNILVDRDLQFG